MGRSQICHLDACKGPLTVVSSACTSWASSCCGPGSSWPWQHPADHAAAAAAAGTEAAPAAKVAPAACTTSRSAAGPAVAAAQVHRAAAAAGVAAVHAVVAEAEVPVSELLLLLALTGVQACCLHETPAEYQQQPRMSTVFSEHYPEKTPSTNVRSYCYNSPCSIVWFCHKIHQGGIQLQD